MEKGKERSWPFGGNDGGGRRTRSGKERKIKKEAAWTASGRYLESVHIQKGGEKGVHPRWRGGRKLCRM